MSYQLVGMHLERFPHGVYVLCMFRSLRMIQINVVMSYEEQDLQKQSLIVIEQFANIQLVFIFSTTSELFHP